MEPTRWLTIAGACKRVQCGKKSIYAAIKSGKLSAAKINERGDYRIAVEWLDRYIESCAAS